MNIYLIFQIENCDYDTYDSLVVCAHSENHAFGLVESYTHFDPSEPDKWSSWAPRSLCNIQLIGKISKEFTRTPHVICASYNAG